MQRAELAGVWRLSDTRRGCEPVSRRFRVVETPASSGYAGLVAAISRGVAQLSEEIATAVAAAGAGC